MNEMFFSDTVRVVALRRQGLHYVRDYLWRVQVLKGSSRKAETKRQK